MKFGKHRCIECGYLCYELTEQRFLGERRSGFGSGWAEYEDVTRINEITNRERNEDLDVRIGRKNLLCYRREVSFEVGLEAILKTHESSETKECPELNKFLDMNRKCRFYTIYIPGYSPNQHLTRWESTDRERSNRRWSLVYIIIGAILTAVGALITKRILG